MDDDIYGDDGLGIKKEESIPQKETNGVPSAEGSVKDLPDDIPLDIKNQQQAKAIYIKDLDWWVSDLQLLQLLQNVQINPVEVEIGFLEHRANGKSRG